MATDLSKRELRRFGLELAAACAVVFGVLPPLLGKGWPMWPWLLGATLCLLATLWPRGLRPLHLVLTKVGHALGWVNSRVLLGFLFYIVLTPIGFMRARNGHDPLRRRYDSSAASYREAVQPRRPEHMKRPF